MRNCWKKKPSPTHEAFLQIRVPPLLLPHEGIADVDIHWLWNREQRMSRAETIFFESLQQRLTD